MKNDNSTPMRAGEYDQKINRTIPYYDEFYKQTISVVSNLDYDSIKWLDLGCGTGTLAKLANEVFDNIEFVMVDPSKEMLLQAQNKCGQCQGEYYNMGSQSIDFRARFDVVSAIMSHHYLSKTEREKATQNVYRALKKGGIYLTFENVVPENKELQQFELKRWGAYQKSRGKTKPEVEKHLARCNVNYFPLTIKEHLELLQKVGFKLVHVFWISYMQAGIYALK